MSGIRFTALMFTTCALMATGCGGSTKSSSTGAASNAGAAPSITTTSASATTASNSTETAPAGKQLTRAALILRADAICARVNKRRTQLNFGSQTDVAKVMPALASFERKAASELGELIPPTAMAGDWKVIVAGAQALASETASYGQFAKANNPEAEHRVFVEAGKAQAKMAPVARRDGLKQCADL